MTDHNLNLAMRISADVTRLMGGLAKGEGGLRKFGNAAKQEMAALGRFAGSVEGRMAQPGQCRTRPISPSCTDPGVLRGDAG